MLRFAVPVGLVAAAATFAAYALAVKEPDVSIAEERTVATIVIACIGLWILTRLARPLTAPRVALVVCMAAGLVAGLAIEPLRSLFGLHLPNPTVSLAAVGVIALALLTLELGDRAALMTGRAVSWARSRHLHSGG